MSAKQPLLIALVTNLTHRLWSYFRGAKLWTPPLRSFPSASSPSHNSRLRPGYGDIVPVWRQAARPIHLGPHHQARLHCPVLRAYAGMRSRRSRSPASAMADHQAPYRNDQIGFHACLGQKEVHFETVNGSLCAVMQNSPHRLKPRVLHAAIPDDIAAAVTEFQVSGQADPRLLNIAVPTGDRDLVG